MDYWTAKQAAESWGITANRVTILCKGGRIPGAIQLGKQWMIPSGIEKPADGRTRQAKEAFFRFPLYVNFSESIFNPPLSEEEKRLRQAQLDFFACEFDRAGAVLSDLAENAKSVYIRIAALSFSCVLSTHGGNETDFPFFFTHLNMELAPDFPHKREMELFLPWLYLFFVEYKTVSEQLKFAPDAPYSPDCFPLIGLLTFSHLFQPDTEGSPPIDPNLYELQCRQVERSGYFYEAQEMHFMLFLYYYLTLNKKYMFYHLRRGLTLALEHDLLFIPACYASFYPSEHSKVLREYPAAFSEKIHRFSKNIHECFARFSVQIGSANIYKNLSQDDYPFVCYATMGYSNRQIAKAMKKSEKFIGNVYKKIYAKLGVTSKQELVVLMKATFEKK